jgi:hypothetical protein
MQRRPFPAEQSGSAQDAGAGADRTKPASSVYALPEPVTNNPFVRHIVE